MSPLHLYAGPASPERCAHAHQLLAAGQTLKAIASDMHCAPSTAKRWAAAHEHMATYDATLEREGTIMALGTVTSPNGLRAAARALYRHHRVTLNRLELPGWNVVVGGRRIDLSVLRDEMFSVEEAA